MDVVLAQLRETWKAQPSMRLCQLIVNATERDDPFYVEDDDLMAHLAAYPAERKRA